MEGGGRTVVGYDGAGRPTNQVDSIPGITPDKQQIEILRIRRDTVCTGRRPDGPYCSDLKIDAVVTDCRLSHIWTATPAGIYECILNLIAAGYHCCRCDWRAGNEWRPVRHILCDGDRKALLSRASAIVSDFQR